MLRKKTVKRKGREPYAAAQKVYYTRLVKRHPVFKSERQLRNAIKRTARRLLSSRVLEVRFMQVRDAELEDISKAKRARDLINRVLKDEAIKFEEMDFLIERLMHTLWYQDMVVEDTRTYVDKKTWRKMVKEEPILLGPLKKRERAMLERLIILLVTYRDAAKKHESKFFE